MKQFFLRTCLAVLSLLTAATSFAQWFEADGIYYEINDDKKSVSVTGIDDSYSGPVTIPSSVSRKDEESDEDEEGTYVVTSIENYAFNFSGEFDPFFPEIDERPRLTSIYIPESVTSIGKEAFSYCSMTSINIPSSITSIGPSTFWNCNRLNSITISSSVTTIEESAFDGCSSLTSINIPSSVTEIGSYGFQFCSGLTLIEIPPSVTAIGEWAFFDCSGLTSIIFRLP